MSHDAFASHGHGHGHGHGQGLRVMLPTPQIMRVVTVHVKKAETWTTVRDAVNSLAQRTSVSVWDEMGHTSCILHHESDQHKQGAPSKADGTMEGSLDRGAYEDFGTDLTSRGEESLLTC